MTMRRAGARARAVGSMIVAALALAAGPRGAAVAQELAVADKSPRFLYASSSGAAPVEIDASQNAMLRRVVLLRVDQPTVGRLLATIERQTGLVFGYGTEFPASRPVTLRADSISVGAALSAILFDTGVDVVLSGREHVALVKMRTGRTAIQQGAIAGRVTDAKTQAAIAGAPVAVDGASRSATTGNDGRYRIGEMAPGTYTLRVRYIGYTPASVSVTVTADQEATADFGLEKSVQRLDEVVTTGTVVPTEVKALPTPVTVITAEDLERQHVRRIGDALRLAVPGAVAWDPVANGVPSYQEMSVRGLSGLSGSNPKIYVDGVEVTAIYEAGVDPQGVDRIEMVRGPQAAAIYGSDAMGGVIQIFTKRGDGTHPRPEVEAQAAVGIIESAYDLSGALRQEYRASLAGRVPNASYRFGGGYRRVGEWMPDYGAGSPSLQGGVRLEQGGLTFDLSARLDQDNYTQSFDPILAATGGFSSGSVPSHNKGIHRTETYVARIEQRIASWWQQSLTVGADRFALHTTQTAPRLLTPDDTLLYAGFFDSRKVSVAYHTALTASPARGVVASITLGVDHYNNGSGSFFTYGAVATDPLRVASGQTVYANHGSTDNTGLFAQAQLNLWETVFLTGAARVEDNSDFGAAANWPLSPKVGATYVHPVGGATVKLRASYGQAIRPPYQGAKDSINYGEGVQLPNRAIRPERQLGPDGGVDLAFGRRGSLSVTYYHQIAKDFVYPLFDFTRTPYVFQAVNLARVKNTGWELEGTLDLGLAAFRGQFAVTHSRPVDLGPIPEGDYRVGKQFDDVPVYTGGLTATATPARHISVSAALAFQGGWTAYDWLGFYRCVGGTGPCRNSDYSLGDYRVQYSAYAKVNLSIEQEFTRYLAGYADVEDLTNTGQKRGKDSSYPVQGRISSLGLRVHY